MVRLAESLKPEKIHLRSLWLPPTSLRMFRKLDGKIFISKFEKPITISGFCLEQRDDAGGGLQNTGDLRLCGAKREHVLDHTQTVVLGCHRTKEICHKQGHTINQRSASIFSGDKRQ